MTDLGGVRGMGAVGVWAPGELALGSAGLCGSGGTMYWSGRSLAIDLAYTPAFSQWAHTSFQP